MKKSSLLHQVSVVGSVAVAASLTKLNTLEDPGCDVLELRLDAYPEESARLRELCSQIPTPILLTARRPEEGGKNQLGLRQRTEMLTALLPFASLVDIEVRSLGEMPEVLAACRQLGVPVVASWHDFTGTPEAMELQDILSAAAAVDGVAAVKFAAVTNSAAELERLLSLFSAKQRTPLSVMGMGELGKVSRLLFAKLGSCLNYGYFDEATVPGQWHAARLKTLLAEL